MASGNYFNSSIAIKGNAFQGKSNWNKNYRKTSHIGYSSEDK
jgi:hypothetical protein